MKKHLIKPVTVEIVHGQDKHTFTFTVNSDGTMNEKHLVNGVVERGKSTWYQGIPSIEMLNCMVNRYYLEKDKSVLIAATPFTSALFSLECGPVYSGYHRESETWNGFNTPRFEIETFRAILNDLGTYTQYGDCFKFTATEEEGFAVINPDLITVNGKELTVYQLSGYIWSTVEQPEILARKFSQLLLAEIGRENLITVIERNKTISAGCCASHDFCDANMVMDAAFKTVTGKKINTQKDEAVELWNQAWDIARTTQFYFNS